MAAVKSSMKYEQTNFFHTALNSVRGGNEGTSTNEVRMNWQCESCVHGNPEYDEQPECCCSCIHELSRIADGTEGCEDNYLSE